MRQSAGRIMALECTIETKQLDLKPAHYPELTSHVLSFEVLVQIHSKTNVLM